MLPASDIQRYIAGAFHLMAGRPEGERMLDLSADGFWSSFQAIVLAVPPLALGWVGYLNRIDDGTLSRAGMIAGLATVDVVAWLLPLVLLALVARPLGLAHRYVAYVVASNWASVPLLWLSVPGELLRLIVPVAGGLADGIGLIVYLFALVLIWRLTNAVLGMGAAVASGVFAGMLVASIVVAMTAQSLLGIPFLG